MSPTRFPEEQYLVNKEDASGHALFGAALETASRLPGLEDWQKGAIRRRPVEIFDINGKLLFLDYAVTAGNHVVGTIRTAASRVLGDPVISLDLGPQLWNYKAAVEKLTPQVNVEYPGWKIVDTKLVCYSYPKLGVMFTIAEGRARQRLIFDVASLTRIPEKRANGDLEGSFAWSFYDSLDDKQREGRLERYAQMDSVVRQLPADTQALLKQEVSIAKLTGVVVEPIQLVKTKYLSFCTHYGSGEPRSHHCFVLHAQQKDDYCAVATCQMILCYYRYYYSQDQIAPALGYGPGGCPSDQSAGYENLTCGHLDATYDTSATFNEAVVQIDALRPFKSGIQGHARACAGYSYSLFSLGTQSQKLYIYDPWPWNADYKVGGTIKWETWGSITHTNYVFARLQY